MIHGRFITEQGDLLIAEDIYRRAYSSQLKDSSVTNNGIIIHAIVYEGPDENCPVAAGCMIMQPDSARLLKVAVLPEYRGKSYGEFIVRMLIDKAETGGIAQILINCKNELSEYFRKLGFMKQDEESISERSEWVNMIYRSDTRKCCSKLI